MKIKFKKNKINNNIFSSLRSLFNFNNVLGKMSYEVGIDLGTANTLVLVEGKGIVIREPSYVARNKKTKEILSIGSPAKKMAGKAPASIEVIRPLRNGVIADFDATQAMLTFYIKKIHDTGTAIPKIPRPRVVIGIPSGVTEVEKRAVADAAIASGAREAFLIEEPIAAALGSDLKIQEPEGVFIVDIGGGTSEMAVISMGGAVVGRSIRIAGDEMDEAIVNYVRLKYSLLLGESTAEDVKINIGSCVAPKQEKYLVVRGRDLESGLPKSLKLSSSEICEALSPIVRKIVISITDTLEETPPELVSDIMEKGIVLAGGGALLPGIDEVISGASKMPVFIADDPLSCVVRGCGKILKDPELLEKIKITKNSH